MTTIERSLRALGAFRWLWAMLPLAAPSTAQVGTIDGPLGRVLDEMGRHVEPCVQPTTTPQVFTLCFDLHSSIHAHWAAYRLARVRPGLAHLALTSSLALEQGKVHGQLQAIVPKYARAWFLLLAIEFERWSVENAQPDPERLRRAGNLIATRLLNRYNATAPNPFAREYQNDAWALLQLYRWYTFVDDGARLALVDGLIRDHFLMASPGAFDLGDDLGFLAGDFFSVYGNWLHLLVETQDPAEVTAFLTAQGPIPTAHLQVPMLVGIHSPGLVWSRLWALRSLVFHAAPGADAGRFRTAAGEHLQAGIDRHAQLVGSFVAYDHWVPQFVVYALTSELR